MPTTGFVRKKVETPTLGEKLKRLREEGRISLGELSRQTKIQVKYLEYLESGNYSKLPADVYVKGFLRSLAIFFGANEQTMVKIYEREKGIQKNIGQYVPKESSPSPLKISTFAITPKIIIATVSIVLTLGGCIYLYREFNAFVATPRLVVETPTNGEMVTDQSVEVTGEADRGSSVLINDTPTIVDDNGRFEERITLQPGLNTIAVRAKNKFDKESTQQVSVRAEYEIKGGEAVREGVVNGASTAQALKLEVETTAESIWLSVEVDGNLVYSGTLAPKMPQLFEGQSKIVIASGNGSVTKVKVNGKDQGFLGSEPVPVRDIIFESGKTY